MLKNAIISPSSPKGFSIIELSIVLTVIALIATSALSVGASRLDNNKIRVTQERMERIMDAIELYVKNFGYLPCPAPPYMDVEESKFGFGLSTTNAPCTLDSSMSSDTATNATEGMLPVSDLNIPPALCVDGWNRRFTYVVDGDLTFSDDTDPLNPIGWANKDEVGNITINSTGGSATTNQAAVVLISRGANGFGAWGAKGGSSQLACPTDTDELVNADSCSVNDSIYVQKFRTDTYDDIIDFRLKWHFEVNE